MQVFHTSPWPVEWIKAHRLEARAVWLEESFASDAPSVSAGVCSFAQNVVCLAKRQREAAFVLTSHCDQMRRAYDVLAGVMSERVFLLNVPATWQTETAVRLFSSELERLSRFLVTLGGRAPKGSELSSILQTGRPSQAEKKEAPSSAIPLAIVGGPLLASHGNFFGEIEKLGGCVVLNATEFGEPALLPDGMETVSPDALAAAFLKGSVAIFQRPNTRFYEWLEQRLADTKVRGIILWHYIACDLWRAEAAHMREAFGLPVLQLEADNAESCSVRNLGRLQAFMESLSRRNA